MSLQTLVADIVARIPEMAEDSLFNNEIALRTLIAEEMKQLDKVKQLLLDYRTTPNCGEYSVDRGWTERVDEAIKICERNGI